MKAEINENKKGFEPIEVKITIESMDELITLVSAFNSSNRSIYENKPSDIKQIPFICVNGSFWNNIGIKLTEIAKQRNK